MTSKTSVPVFKLNSGLEVTACTKWAEDVPRHARDGCAGRRIVDLHFHPLSLSVVFLGRHELAAQADPIKVPYFFHIHRNDQYDASAGCRWRFAGTGSVGLNAIVPLDRQGFRPAVIPTIEVEYSF